VIYEHRKTNDAICEYLKSAGGITGILKESVHELNKCVIVATHSNELAAQADTVLKLKHGSLYSI